MTLARRLAAALAVSALLGAAGMMCAAAPDDPLPRVPEMVWELYLPEEYDACGVAYGLYATLPEADREKLHAGTKTSSDAKTLARYQARTLAVWFNSARWGCDAPAERLDAGGVRRSTVVFKCEDSVVEFCLQSPDKGIWKKLTIACAPERAEWVRDGLPLLPAWIMVPWDGGTMPPEPPSRPGYVSAWQRLRHLYRGYAELSPDSLRQLHQQHELRFDFGDLPDQQQQAIADAYDRFILSSNMAFGQDLNHGRSPELRARRFGITKAVFTYARSSSHVRRGAEAISDIDIVPRPYRVVYLEMNPLGLESRESGELVPISRCWPVAIPADLQGKVLDGRREQFAWLTRWKNPDGSNKPGAPPYPGLW